MFENQIISISFSTVFSYYSLIIYTKLDLWTPHGSTYARFLRNVYLCLPKYMEVGLSHISLNKLQAIEFNWGLFTHYLGRKCS